MKIYIITATDKHGDVEIIKVFDSEIKADTFMDNLMYNPSCDTGEYKSYFVQSEIIE